MHASCIGSFVHLYILDVSQGWGVQELFSQLEEYVFGGPTSSSGFWESIASMGKIFNVSLAVFAATGYVVSVLEKHIQY